MLKIKSPCPENWESMKIGLHSRYCDNCKKDVIDFTNKNRQEILEYLLSNNGKQTCARIFPSQLDFTHTDLMIIIESYSTHQKNTNIPFYLLTLGTAMLAGCGGSGIKNEESLVKKNSISAYHHALGQKTGTCNTKTNNGLSEPDTMAILGDLTSYPANDADLSPVDSNAPVVIADVMPEFKGGFDNLRNYLKRNLQYPDWERKNNVQGIVYVSFTVEKTGKVKDPLILKSVSGSKNFDTEVVRVINAMPYWKAGMNKDKTVAVRYYLPVKFTLTDQ